MDAAEDEQDVQLQKAALGLLADFDSALKSFLWRTLHNGKLRIRRRVRARETERLLRLLAPFQELPQLLDPHLEKFLPVLADAYLETLRTASSSEKPTKHATLLMPLSTAICQLLYTFCKIRGEKVIVRFLNAETRNLELLLSAIENSEDAPVNAPTEEDVSSESEGWTWEERYICLLWLSHLLLAPFDLATISSAGTGDIEKPQIDGLVWPQSLPGVTLRVVPLAMKYLASAGKERDAAKALLVRISMRRDMQDLGLLHALVQWALSHLQSTAVASTNSVYSSVGILSYLAGVLVASTNTSDMDAYLLKIYRVVQAISTEENAAFKNVHSSALARKTVIKVLRTITVLALRGTKTPSHHDMETTEIVETTIGHLLEALADNDTPVRLAASKALSVITLKLAPIMAAQVVDAVLESLNHNVLWIDDKIDQGGRKTRDLSAVNPLEWHGLILTLSHLLYRRSPPPDSLSDILHALLIGLSFERRSTSGSSIGSNVRDAACFGIWALARRYTTAELQGVVKSSVFAAKQHDSSSSIIQVLATELVVSASLDPAGNIRRGASAALQELIGRHPDIVAEGIAVVQVVDYHAVALRSRAILEVAPKAALLSRHYQDALLDALFAWRGVGDGDATSRRNAAAAVGLLVKGFQEDRGESTLQRSVTLMERIEKQLNGLKARQIDQRHGLLLSIAAVITCLSEDLVPTQNGSLTQETIDKTLRLVTRILEAAKTSPLRRPELVAESVSRVISAAVSVLRIELLHRFSAMPSDRGINADSKPSKRSPLSHGHGEETLCVDAAASIKELEICWKQNISARQDVCILAEDLLVPWLRLTEKEVIDAATEAAVSLASIIDHEMRRILVEKWVHEFLGNGGNRVFAGYSLALAALFSIVEEAQQDQICRALEDRWQTNLTIESRVVVLQSLTEGNILNAHTSQAINIGIIADGLDDYTTDGRGDIGSLVRVEALKAARKAFSMITSSKVENEGQVSPSWLEDIDTFSTIYAKVLRLSAEKLDRVRAEAQQTLALVCQNKDQRQHFSHLPISSSAYFTWLLDLQTHPWLSLHHTYSPHHWLISLLEGYVTSADTGSEDLIRASRAALAGFCERERAPTETPSSPEEASKFICSALVEVAKKNLANDRVLVPTMEVMSYLFDVGIMQRNNLDWRAIYLLIQKSHYKTGNVRKLEAAVKLYGGLCGVYPEAMTKLSSMLLHPFPKVRNCVADVVFVVSGRGKGVAWTRAGKGELGVLRGELEGWEGGGGG